MGFSGHDDGIMLKCLGAGVLAFQRYKVKYLQIKSYDWDTLQNIQGRGKCVWDNVTTLAI